MKGSGLGLLCLFLSFSLLSCSTQPTHSDRNPASEMAENGHENADDLYQEIMSSKAPAQGFNNLLDRSTQIYFLTAKWIGKFDQDVQKKTPLFKSDTYARLQAARSIGTHMNETFLALWERLNEDLKSNPAKEAELTKVREQIVDHVKTLSKGPSSFAVEDIVAGMHLTSSPTRGELEISLAAEETQGHFQRQLKQLIENAKASDADTAEIEREADLIRADYAAFLASQKERLPAQSGKVIFPSTGSSGNIVGGAFPDKTWVLTYDDGPHTAFTPQIMGDLEAAGFKGTFFWLGKLAGLPQMKTIIARAKAKGHHMNNHSMSHRNFGAVTPGQMRSAIQTEIINSDAIETKAYGYKPAFYRCPYGACTRVQPVRQTLANMGYIHAFWAVDSLDWNKAANPRGAIDIANRVKKQMQAVKKGVILFHDIHAQSAAASKLIIRYIKSLEPQGHRQITLCQAVDEANKDPQGTFCSSR